MFLTLEDVRTQTKLARSTIYQLIQRGGFPAPCKIGASSRWLRSEVEAWVNEKAKAREVAQ